LRFYIVVVALMSCCDLTGSRVCAIDIVSLHDARPSWSSWRTNRVASFSRTTRRRCCSDTRPRRCSPCPSASSCPPSNGSDSFDGERKSPRLNSSHQISTYAVFCLKKTECTKLDNHLSY